MAIINNRPYNMNLERQIVLQKKEEATAPSVKSDSSGSSGCASSSSPAPQVSNIIVDNNFLMTYRGINITSKPAETWDDVDEILQSSSQSSVSGGVKADSASSVSGGGQTGAVSSDNTSSVSGGGGSTSSTQNTGATSNSGTKVTGSTVKTDNTSSVSTGTTNTNNAVKADSTGSVSSGASSSASTMKTKVMDAYTVNPDDTASTCKGVGHTWVHTVYGIDFDPVVDTLDKEVKRVLNIIAEQIEEQCWKNNIPFDEDIVNDVIEDFKRSPDYPSVKNARSKGIITVKNTYFVVDRETLFERVASSLNVRIRNAVNTNFSKITEIPSLEYKYDPECKLSQDEQAARVTVRNIAVLFKNAVDKYGDREIEFNGEKCMISTLAYTLFKASNSTPEIKAFTKMISGFGENISQKIEESDSKPRIMTRCDGRSSMDDFSSGDDEWFWNQGDGSFWAGSEVVITPDGGGVEDWDPMSDENWLSGFGGIEDQWSMLEQDSAMDEWFGRVSDYSDEIGTGTTIGGVVGSMDKFKGVGYLASLVSYADAGLDMYKNGINFNNGFAAATTTVGCAGMWGAACSAVANAYKDGIEWTAEFFSGLESQMQKLFSSPDWMGKFMMGF